MSEINMFEEYQRHLYSYNHTKVEIFYEESVEKIEGHYLLSDSECPDMVMTLKVLKSGVYEVDFHRPLEEKVLRKLRREYSSLTFEVYNRESAFSSVNVVGEEDELEYFFDSLDVDNVELPEFGRPLSFINIKIS